MIEEGHLEEIPENEFPQKEEENEEDDGDEKQPYSSTDSSSQSLVMFPCVGPQKPVGHVCEMMDDFGCLTDISLQHNPQKRQRKDTSEKEHPESGNGTLTQEDKQKWILKFTDLKQDGFTEFYPFFSQDKMTPESLGCYSFPSHEQPSLIPLIYPVVPEMMEGKKSPHFESYSPSPGRKFTPNVSPEMIVKFLSLVHLNTVTGLESQAVVYSCSSSSTTKHLVISSCKLSSSCAAIYNKEHDEGAFLELLSKEETLSSHGKKPVPWCVLITHPTTNVFLTDLEIAQLYDYT